MNDLELDQCIHKIGENDMAALQALYEEMQKPVYLYILSMLHHTASAEDLTQTVFLNIRAYAPKYHARGKAKAWIFTIAKNLVLSEYRKSGRTEGFEEHENTPSSLSVEGEVLSRDRVLALLGLLKEAERQIVTLHLYGGLNHQEIALALSLPYEQVRWKYAYALKKMKKQLQ